MHACMRACVHVYNIKHDELKANVKRNIKAFIKAMSFITELEIRHKTEDTRI